MVVGVGLDQDIVKRTIVACLLMKLFKMAPQMEVHANAQYPVKLGVTMGIITNGLQMYIHLMGKAQQHEHLGRQMELYMQVVVEALRVPILNLHMEVLAAEAIQAYILILMLGLGQIIQEVVEEAVLLGI